MKQSAVQVTPIIPIIDRRSLPSTSTSVVTDLPPTSTLPSTSAISTTQVTVVTVQPAVQPAVAVQRPASAMPDADESWLDEPVVNPPPIGRRAEVIALRWKIQSETFGATGCGHCRRVWHETVPGTIASAGYKDHKQRYGGNGDCRKIENLPPLAALGRPAEPRFAVLVHADKNVPGQVRTGQTHTGRITCGHCSANWETRNPTQGHTGYDQHLEHYGNRGECAVSVLPLPKRGVHEEMIVITKEDGHTMHACGHCRHLWVVQVPGGTVQNTTGYRQHLAMAGGKTGGCRVCTFQSHRSIEPRFMVVVYGKPGGRKGYLGPVGEDVMFSGVTQCRACMYRWDTAEPGQVADGFKQHIINNPDCYVQRATESYGRDS
jgi:hypothetical protein